MAAKLTDKQKRFVQEYLVDQNGTQAVIRAGYSENGASVTGVRLLLNPKIKALVDKKNRETSDKLEITRERVLNEMARVAFHDPRKFFDEEGNLIPIVDLDDDTAAALAGMDVNMRSTRGPDGETQINETEGVHKIKLADKLAALDKLSRHLGLFEKDNQQSAPTIIISKEDADL